MPHIDGTLTKGERRDIDQNRRILAERATVGILNALVAGGLEGLQEKHLRRALAKAYNEGQDDQRSRAKG